MAGPYGMRGLPPVNIAVERRPGVFHAEATSPRALESAPTAPGVHRSFSEFLSEQINEVNDLHKQADEAVAAMATGRSHNLHEMMIALDRADVSLRMLTKVRNKAVEAYQEIMRMHI